MREFKKPLSIFMASIFIMAGILGNITAKAAVIVAPTISRVGLGHSPLIEGDTRTFTVTSPLFVGKVQYRAFLNDVKSKVSTEITTGYREVVDGKDIFVLPVTKAFKVGDYKLTVYVKRAGKVGIKSNSLGNYDTYYVSNLKCVGEVLPTISRIGLGHPLITGDRRTFTVTSSTYVGNVQYRAFLSDGKVWTEITKGYTEAVDAKAVVVLPETRSLSAGTYRLSVWVKKAGTFGNIITHLGNYDSYKVSTLKVSGANVLFHRKGIGYMKITGGSGYHMFNGGSSSDVEIYINGTYICVKRYDYNEIDLFPYWSTNLTVTLEETGQVLYRYIPPNKK